MDILLIQAAIIFLPGIIWARIDASYASRRKPSEFIFTLNALAFGILTYAVLFVVYRLIGWEFSLPTISTTELAGSNFNPFFDEVLFSVPTAFIGSTIWCYSARYRWLMYFLHSCGASKSFGDEDVWEFAFNDEGIESKYAFVRDRKNKIVFSGRVDVFSGSNQTRELILSDVTVLDDVTGAELYTSPRTYLEFTDGWTSIDFPLTEKDQELHVKE